MLETKKGSILIREMNLGDIPLYVSKCKLTKEEKEENIRECREILKSRTKDTPDLYFTVLRNNVVIGVIVTKCIENTCDANLTIDIPRIKDKEYANEIAGMFIDFCRETYIYDNIHAYYEEDGQLVRATIKIASQSS